ncbi:MAG: enoyl-CoA hydratase/isomerase family protein [Deltaproteobacteria bacterium]|nr:enoyl-CoA hydratase/isomerase family protein [Deltaproteobacteria bacterium]
MSYECLEVAKEPPIATVTLNRPKQLNALGLALAKEIAEAMEALDIDPEVRAIVLTGGEKVFAAGADIKEMAEATPFDERVRTRMVFRDRLNRISKPIIAAVSGYALGAGCEMAMSCDIIVASETARFGQPEVNLGIIPGSGGTQRLARAVGKYRAMEIVLTGEFLNASEAHRLGLVNKIVPVELLLEEAKGLAKKIAAKPPLAIKLAKEAILKSFNTPLDEGIDFERKCFYLLLASEDKQEGMRAFLEKRRAEFKGK